MRRFAFRLALALLALPATALLALAGALLLLDAGIGRDSATAALNRLLADSVRVEGLDFALSGRLGLARVELLDPAGAYAAASGVQVDWRPAALLAGRLEVAEVRAATLEATRPPAVPPVAAARPAPSAELPALPRLPVSVTVERLSLPEIRLGPALLGGTAALLAAEGRLALPARGGTLDVDLSVQRRDAPGNASVLAALSPDGERLELTVYLEEPPEGVLSGLLDLPGRPELSLLLEGSGPLAAFEASLAFRAGDAGRFDGTVRLARLDTAWQIDFDGAGDLARLLPAEVAPLAGSQQTLAARAVAGDDGTAELARLEFAAGALAAQGSAALAADRRLRGSVQASLPLAALEPLAGAPLEGTARLRIDLAGRAEAPEAALALTLDAPRHAAAGARTARLAARLALAADGALAASGDYAIEGLAAAGLPPGFADWQGEFRASRAAGATTLRLERATLARDGLEAVATGSFDPAAGFQARLEVTVAQLAALPLPLQPAPRGRVQLSADLSGSPSGAIGAAVRAEAAELQSGVPAADALLGGRATLRASLQADAEAGLRIDGLQLDAGRFRASGSARLPADGARIDASLLAQVPDLTPLGRALGLELSGGAEARLAAAGTTASPDLRLQATARDAVAAGVALGEPELRLSLADAARTGRGEFTLRAAPLGEPAALSANLARAGERLRLEALRFDAAGLRGEGGLVLRLDAGTAEGELALAAPDLARLGRLAGTPLAGRLDATVKLAAAQGGQNATLAGTLDGLDLDEGTLGLARATLQATLTDLARNPGGTLRLAARNLVAGERRLDRLEATARLAEGRQIAFAASATGTQPALDLALEGTAEADAAERRLRLTKLQGTLEGAPVRLGRTATLRQDAAGWALADLDLRLGDGRIAGTAAYAAGGPEGRLEIAALPLAPLAGAAMAPPVSGRLDAVLALAGSRTAPQATLTAGLDLDADPRTGLPPVGANLAADWRERRLQATLGLAGVEGVQADGRLAMPLDLDLASFRLAGRPADGLDGRLGIDVDLARLTAYLPSGLTELAGRFAGELALAGRGGALSVNGEAALSGGVVEVARTGGRLQNLRFRLVGDGAAVRLLDLAADDGAQGRLTGSGGVRFAGAEPAVDLAVEFQAFQVARIDELRATAGGRIALAGPLAAPKLAGTVRVARAEIEIPRRLPPSVVALDVVEVNLPPGRRPEEQAQPPPAGGGAGGVALDLTIELPGQVFVRGRGLDSEWAGSFHIGGTSAAPVVDGRLSALRGGIALGGIAVTIEHGEIRLAPDEDGRLAGTVDLLATAKAAEVTAEVRVSGGLADPDIGLSSTPVLPRDEILARLLFGRNVGALTAAQAVQLGQAALELSGGLGGGGLLADVRRSLALDEFSVGGGQGEGLSGAGLSAGKYLNDRTYVGVRQGLSAESTSVIVRYRLLENLSLEGAVGSGENSDVGITYERRY